MRKIAVEQLSQIFDRIMKKLREENWTEIAIETDGYRFIHVDDWTDYAKDEILVGSLNDDIDSLLLMIKDQDRPCLYIDFDRFASLMRAIAKSNHSV